MYFDSLTKPPAQSDGIKHTFAWGGVIKWDHGLNARSTYAQSPSPNMQIGCIVLGQRAPICFHPAGQSSAHE